jgi:hypothetical protein
MRFAAILVVLTSLAGCAQYDAIRNENLAAASRDKVASDDASCRSSGAPGSAAYEDCRKRYANQHASESHSQERLANQMLNDKAPIPGRGE